MTNSSSGFGQAYDERTAEAQYAREGLNEFRVIARRNRLLALWAAEKMNMTKTAAENYAMELVAGAYTRAGQDIVLERIAVDFGSANIAWTDAEFRQLVAQFTIDAESQLSSR